MQPLTAPQYEINVINAKIETTLDDNYSDDELTFLPYYTYLSNAMDPVKVGLCFCSAVVANH